MLVKQLGRRFRGEGSVAIRAAWLRSLGIVFMCSKMLAFALCAPSILVLVSPDCGSPVQSAADRTQTSSYRGGDTHYSPSTCQFETLARSCSPSLSFTPYRMEEVVQP